MKLKKINSIIWASALNAVTRPNIERKGVKKNTHIKIKEIAPTFLKKGPTDSIRLDRTIKRKSTAIIPVKPARWTNSVIIAYLQTPISSTWIK